NFAIKAENKRTCALAEDLTATNRMVLVDGHDVRAESVAVASVSCVAFDLSPNFYPLKRQFVGTFGFCPDRHIGLIRVATLPFVNCPIRQLVIHWQRTDRSIGQLQCLDPFDLNSIAHKSSIR